MKKLIAFALILTVALTAIGATAEVYPLTAKVIELDYNRDLVAVETFMGLVYVFEGCEDWQEGDCASLIMDDNGTEQVYDDIILMAQYSAWRLINWME